MIFEIRDLEIFIRDSKSREPSSRFRVSRSLFKLETWNLEIFSHLEINLEKPFSRLPLYLEINFPFRSEIFHYSRFLINLETWNLEIIQQLRDKSRKTVSRCKNLGLKNSVQQKVSFVSGSDSPSRDFKVSRLMRSLEILKSRLELQKSRD